MIQDVKKYIEPYVTFSEPIPYKNLYIYPIKLNKYYEFISCVDILLFEKNKIPDINIIQMSYLKFLATKLINNEEMFDDKIKKGDIYSFKFFSLMALVFNVDISKINIAIDKNDVVYLKVDDEIFTAQEFDDIKKIILFQNLNDYDDVQMSDDYKKVIEEYYSIKNKGMIVPTLEDKIDAVMAKTSYNEKSIKELTYRRFCRIFDKVVSYTEYVVGCNGYTRKEPPENWIYKTNKQKYSEVFGSDKFNELQNK